MIWRGNPTESWRTLKLVKLAKLIIGKYALIISIQNVFEIIELICLSGLNSLTRSIREKITAHVYQLE